MRDGIAGLFAVVLAGARLWLRHWPVLLSIALLGAAGRMGAIWGATLISNHNNTLGVLVLVLAPLASVTAIVMMLYSLRDSLPHIASAEAADDADADGPGAPRRRRLLDMLASVLVPFLAVYASYGLLKEDTDRYVNAAVADEFLNNADLLYHPSQAIDTSRFVFATGWMAVAIVAGALIFRFALDKLERFQGRTGIGLVGAYVEVLWLTTLAAHFTLYKDRVWDWAESRRGIEMFAGWWLDLLSRLGPLANPVDYVTNWLFGLLGNFDAIVVVPVSWLTVGAVVYGHSLATQSKTTSPDDEASAAAQRRRDVLARVPRPIRRWSSEVTADLRGRFAGLASGLRQLAIAGLAPMLIFGLAFLASARLEDGLDLLARALMGPQPLDTWLAFSPHVVTLTRSIGLTVTICLLAAAVDRVLAAGQAQRAAAQDGRAGTASAR
jgi:hypothetical protein